MIESPEPIGDIASYSSDKQKPSIAGPLFKEIYSGFIDVENPDEWEPLLNGETRSLLAHTTDVQNLAQFRTLQHVPEHGLDRLRLEDLLAEDLLEGHHRPA